MLTADSAYHVGHLPLEVYVGMESPGIWYL